MFDNESLEAYLQIAGVITQAELPIVRAQGRLGEYAVTYRIYRNKQGGGFGDTSKKPFAWAVLVYADGLPLRLNSARGDCREWSTLESVSDWMRKNGFRYWWTRNDLEFEPAEVPAAVEVPVEALVEAQADDSAAINPEIQPAAVLAVDSVIDPSAIDPTAVDPAIAVQPYAYGDTAAAYIAETSVAPYAGEVVTEPYMAGAALSPVVEILPAVAEQDVAIDSSEAIAENVVQGEAVEQESTEISSDGSEEKTN